MRIELLCCHCQSSTHIDTYIMTTFKWEQDGHCQIIMSLPIDPSCCYRIHICLSGSHLLRIQLPLWAVSAVVFPIIVHESACGHIIYEWYIWWTTLSCWVQGITRSAATKVSQCVIFFSKCDISISVFCISSNILFVSFGSLLGWVETTTCILWFRNPHKLIASLSLLNNHEVWKLSAS